MCPIYVSFIATTHVAHSIRLHTLILYIRSFYTLIYVSYMCPPHSNNYTSLTLYAAVILCTEGHIYRTHRTHT